MNMQTVRQLGRPLVIPGYLLEDFWIFDNTMTFDFVDRIYGLSLELQKNNGCGKETKVH